MAEYKFQTLQKVKDMMKYGFTALRQFPKSEKFTLAADIKHIMNNMLYYCITIEKKISRKTTLEKLDIEVAALKAYLEIAQEMGFLSEHTYGLWNDKVVEIGKMVGGLLEAAKRTENHRE